MEFFTELCENLWTIMIIGSFFVCLAKGWLKKGFYLSAREISKEQEKEEKGRRSHKKRN